MPDDPTQPEARSIESASQNGNGAHGSPPRADGLLDRLKGLIGFRSSATLRKDLEEALAEDPHDSVFSPQERTMLENVLGFRELRVVDVMVPRADIIAVALDTSLAELLRVFRTASHSRLPVYGETLDDPKGMLHIRDFLDFLATRAEAGAAQRRRSSAKAAKSGTTKSIVVKSGILKSLASKSPTTDAGAGRQAMGPQLAGRDQIDRSQAGRCQAVRAYRRRLRPCRLWRRHARPAEGCFRSRCCRSCRDARQHEIAATRPLRAALDASTRSFGADAGDANPYRARHRRIWRHGWARLDRGSRRDDRRRYRGRA